MDEDRLKHSLAVALKMMEIGRQRKLNEKQLKELFVLGYNHDIGYQFEKNENHNIVGAQILRESGYKYWQEVYYHGTLNKEYKSVFLDILNEADMQIDKYGNDVGYDKRLEDIKNRYGEFSKVYNNAKILIETLKQKNR